MGEADNNQWYNYYFFCLNVYSGLLQNAKSKKY
jgi:hypothetical protein